MCIRDRCQDKQIQPSYHRQPRYHSSGVAFDFHWEMNLCQTVNEGTVDLAQRKCVNLWPKMDLFERPRFQNFINNIEHNNDFVDRVASMDSFRPSTVSDALAWSKLDRKRVLTQQCFNPAFSAFKEAALRLVAVSYTHLTLPTTPYV